jgi:protein TonB
MNGTPDAAASRERLVTMLFLTALLHAILLLGVTFSAGVRGRPTPGMEVLLVTEDAPAVELNDKAAYAAQRSQLGAGNTRIAATSSPAARANSANDEDTDTRPAGDGTLLRTSADAPEVRYLGTVLAVAARRNARLDENRSDSQSGRGDGLELVLRGDPATGKWISPDTRALRLAPYLDVWRRKIERLGTLNYPASELRGRQHVAPVIEVALRSDGSLQSAAVQRGSGDLALDQAALNILRLASPFSPFPMELAAEYGVLRFAYQWEFEAGAGSGTVTAPTNSTPAP